MSNNILTKYLAIATEVNPQIVAEYPPVQAWSNKPGVNAIAGHDLLDNFGILGIGKAGHGVCGVSSSGDGVHGETAGTSMSGVAGVHSQGGNGVYGRSDGNAGCFDGKVQVNGDLTVTGDVFVPGADCAEHFDVESKESLQPGDVVVIGQHGRLTRSVCEYDRRAAGVVAAAGAFKPGIVLDARSEADGDHAAISLLGKACCFADARYGAIRPGDLLTTSNTPGHAMRAGDPLKSLGAVIGKALGSLEDGTGLIPMLVTLK